MRLTINIDDRFGNEIKRLASAKGVSVSRFIVGTLEKTLLKERKRKAIRQILDLAGDDFSATNDALEQLETGRHEDENRF